jgi:acyl carrier protein
MSGPRRDAALTARATAESFIDDPFSDDPGARLYRTGDLVRFLPGGDVDFLGRVDQQVKIRGFRIELGEIETVLGRHPDVREAAVVARTDAPGEEQLVAYLVSAGGQTPGVPELRNFVSGTLPDYMVPSAFVWLEALPLTTSGKVDRRALPVPAWDQIEQPETFVAPRSAIEQELAQMWAEVLAVERVGVYDNFFALGGHSLIATQLISRLRANFQVDLPLRRLFEAPTVAGLANLIEEGLLEQVSAAELNDLLDELEGLSEEDLQELADVEALS